MSNIGIDEVVSEETVVLHEYRRVSQDNLVLSTELIT